LKAKPDNVSLESLTCMSLAVYCSPGRLGVSSVPMQRLWCGPVLLAVLFSSGCATTAFGFGDSEFVGKNSGYRISYAEPSKWLVVPDDWELENYFVNGHGRPYKEKVQGIY